MLYNVNVIVSVAFELGH